MKYRTELDAERVQIDWPDDAVRAKQSFRDEVDINNILARYQRTGVLETSGSEPQYADVSEIEDFQSANFRVADILSAWENLSAAEQQKYGDPLSFAVSHEIEVAGVSPRSEAENGSQAVSGAVSDDSAQDEPAQEAHDSKES